MQVRKALKILACLAVLAASLLFVQIALAQNFGLNEVGNEIALVEGDPRVIAARIVRVALGFLGVVALGIVLYGGFVWMTSGGNEEKISTAKKILTNGLIGLVIILMAFGITQYVLNTLMAALTGAGGEGGPSGRPLFSRTEGSLGNGIVESHYPPRGGTGIARNTKIIITFKEPMALDSIIEGYDIHDPANPGDDTLGGVLVTSATIFPLKSENIRIYQSLQGEYGTPPTPGAPQPPNFLQPSAVNVTFTDDHQNFVFDPVEYLGSPTENIWYTTSLKPEIKKADGSDAFTDAFSDGYAWDFEVSTIVDVTPPKVESVIPGRDTTNARNILVQVNFNEAMDPTTVAGKTTRGFNKIEVLATNSAGIATPVAGTWAIGNQYKTIEFTTDLLCGTNSCGGDVFCLPSDAGVRVTVKAAELGTTPPEAEMPYTGATDVVGNSLDGNRNGEADGPTADNYLWNFRTNDEIDLIPPRIELPLVPGAGESDVPLDAPVEIQFSKQMSVTSFSSENIILDDNERAACAVWFTLGGEGTNADGTIPSPKPPDWTPVKHKAIIYHGDFIESTEAPTPAPICADEAVVDEQLVRYFPRATHRIKDIYQNCFYEPVGPAGGTSCTVAGGAGCTWDIE
ncbi:Ig-like domain-containing protein [Candidatus Falkowbacteria bacterium]|nr:Ig-like domain-containing protein [Candidatus Falkowbacteria bacterium]